MQLSLKQSRVAIGASARRTAVAARTPVRAGKVGRRAVVVRAEQESQFETSVRQLAEKWERVENKPGVILYGVGAAIVLWLSNTIISAVNAIPLVPKVFELVGLGYTSWFVYRYLLFQDSRQELVKDVEDLKKKITGDDL